jgi:hypothetical protein
MMPPACHPIATLPQPAGSVSKIVKTDPFQQFPRSGQTAASEKTPSFNPNPLIESLLNPLP